MQTYQINGIKIKNMIIFITLDILIRYTHTYIFIPACIFIPTYNKRAISTKLSPTRASSGFFINFMSCSFLQPINHTPTPKPQTLHEKIICIYLWKLSTHETLCCLSPSYPLVTKWIIRYYSRRPELTFDSQIEPVRTSADVRT